MATQALYRRYRPRRFSEVRGQEHIVRALRNAVINHREGQAYLFSGPRGTGKTTSARILAKVLNCERPVEGEPCCECDSCVAVERGTSYDVHELDAASNNGVDAMRDLIEKASLGTPGRHKVYILDEVHMLSKAAEAALLKTLEEPPPHVVFVLATTDPQKVSDTIRSRTQHLRFHLLPMDELEQHIRWVAADAGLQVSEAAIMSALEQGGGSARDTLSALELVASTGGDDLEVVQYDEFVESLVELDPGRALTAVAFAVQQGRDPRSLTEDVVRYLRDCFLSLMAPELVALPDSRAVVVAEQAGRLGAGKVVKAMERLGEILVEMRHAPDPRLLLEVALVQLTHQAASNDIGALMDRIDRLEKALAEGGPRPAVAASTPVDPVTGRVPLGARARRDATGPMARPSLASVPDAEPTPAVVSVASVPAGPASAAPEQPAARSVPTPTPTPVRDHPSTDAPAAPADPAPAAPAARPVADAAAPRPSTPAASPSPAGAGGAAGTGGADEAVARWAEIVPALKPLVRAIYSVPKLLGVRDGALTLGAPNDAHRTKCEQHRAEVERVAADVVGAPVRVVIVTDASARSDDHDDHDPRDDPRDQRDARGPADGARGGGPTYGLDAGPSATVVALHPSGPPPADEDIDLNDLVDAPPDSVVSPIDRLAQAFPGSELMDERH
ncbi:MAG: DNA polymerase III subunit gamma/tau [Actinobacteria bacterium]|nr:DNA polymerase III subunit gamma/tau [Actinomycetota bacterium]